MRKSKGTQWGSSNRIKRSVAMTRSGIRGIQVAAAKSQYRRTVRKRTAKIGQKQTAQKTDTAKLRIWTLRFWVFRAQDCLSRDRCATPFFYHFSVHLSSVLGRTELCHEAWTPGPQKPQIINNENHHLALLEKSEKTIEKVQKRSKTSENRQQSVRKRSGCAFSHLTFFGHFPVTI